MSYLEKGRTSMAMCAVPIGTVCWWGFPARHTQLCEHVVPVHAGRAWFIQRSTIQNVEWDLA